MPLTFHSDQIVDAPQLFPAPGSPANAQGTAHAFLIRAEKNYQSTFALDGVDPQDGWILNLGGLTQFRVPVFQPETWVGLTFHSSRLKRCIEAIARSSVGLGASAYIPKTLEGGRNKSKAALRDRELLQDLIDHPNPKIPLAEVLYRAEYDRQSAGSGYLEILEKGAVAKGSVYGINHMPTVGVRVHVSGDLFVRIARPKNSSSTGLTEKRTYYRRFGDLLDAHRYVDSTTGDFYTEWPAKLPVERQGTALLQLTQYSPIDDFYGQPTAVSALTAVVSNHLIGLWNLNFLHNNAHIPLAIVVENGNLSKDSKEYIEAFLQREARGLRNTGRVLILEPDLKSGMQATQVKIRLEPMKLGVQEDASFLKLRETNNDEIREAFGLANIFLGSDGSAQSRSAAAVRQVSQEQVIEPQATLWEYVLNYNISRRIGGGTAKIRLKRPLNLDTSQLASVVNRIKDGLTTNDLRDIGSWLLQLPEDLPQLKTEFADVPMAEMKMISREIVKARYAAELAEEEAERLAEQQGGVAQDLEEDEV